MDTIVLSDLIDGIKTVFLADEQVKAMVNKRVCFAQAGQIPSTWFKDAALAISPELSTPLSYPIDITANQIFSITVYAYTENFGDEAAYKKLLTLEHHVKRLLVAGNNEDFYSFDGLVWGCFWKGTAYPEAHLRNFEGLNEARIRFEYRI